MAQQDYFNRVYRDARDLDCNHVQATLCATQSSLETGWGKRVKGNSYFGIKAGKSWKGKVTSFTTHEVIGGKRRKMVQQFRAYADQRDSIKDYIETMARKWPDAWGAGAVEEAARGLLTGTYGAYATDPTYVDGVWKTGRKRGPLAQMAYEGKPGKEEVKEPPKSNIAEKGRPQQPPEITRQILDHNMHLVPPDHRKDGTYLLAVRGYFRDSKGKKGQNDRGIYDDALFVVSSRGAWSFNANVDPSVYRKRVASYKTNQAISFKQGIHGHSKPKSQRYRAFEQLSAAKVHRDQVEEDFGDFSMNIHRGSSRGSTSSLGCITVPYGSQWTEFFNRACREMDTDEQSVIWLILLEYQGGKPPLEIAPLEQNTTQEEQAADTEMQRFAPGHLEALDEMAFQTIQDIDHSRQAAERNTYYDGYASGQIELASRLRKFVREVDPNFDDKVRKSKDRT